MKAQFRLSLILAFASASMMFCAPAPISLSEQSGYYEEVTREELQKYKGKLTVIPEYHRVSDVVVVDALLEETIQQMRSAVEKVGARLMIVRSDARPNEVNGNNKWARDWGPLTVKSPAGRLLMQFNYLPEREFADRMPMDVARKKSVPLLGVPVHLEGGNFMINDDGLCMTTTAVLNQNTRFEEVNKRSLEVPVGNNQEVINSYFMDYLGCKKVKFFEAISRTESGDKTGHIDLWGKFVSNNTVIVADIEQEVLQASQVPSSFSRERSERVKAFFDQRAAEIESLGLNVVRLPIPPIAYSSGVIRRMFSYVNMLLINGTAIVPSFSGAGKDSDLEKLLYSKEPGARIFWENTFSQTERKVQTVLQQLGFKVVFVKSDEYVNSGGAIHCLTMQLHLN